MELMQVSNQWASRPNDERFTNLYDLLKVTEAIDHTSQSRVMKLSELKAIPVPDSDNGLQIVGPSGNGASLTNWAYNQLCTKAEIPAGYIAKLPAELASRNINHGIANANHDDIGLLVTRYPDQDNALGIRAITGPNYTRISNASVIRELTKYVGNGIGDSDWQVLGEFGKPVEVTKENTTMFGSERDIFVSFADEKNRVEIPNRRDGKPGTLARGIIVWNSEVGSQTFGITSFLFDFACANRIIWGAQDVVTFKKRHTKNVLDVWQDGFKQIEAYANAKASNEQDKLIEAINYRIVDLGKTITNESEQDTKLRRSQEATKFLTQKLPLPGITNKLVDGITSSFVKAEQRPIDSLFDCVTAVTEHAKTIPFQDERVKLERAGGKLLDLVSIGN